MKKGFYAMTVEDGEGRHEINDPIELPDADFDHLVSYGVVSEKMVEVSKAKTAKVAKADTDTSA